MLYLSLAKYNGDVLYNVLLENHDFMIVNNLFVETLHPKNLVARLFNGSYSLKERTEIILNINDSIKNNSDEKYEKIYKSICK